MAGGIQLSTTATSIQSAKLDGEVKVAAKNVYAQHKYDLWYQSKLRKDQIPFGVGATAPDGGIFFTHDNIPILMVEAKHQGPLGNAIERWYKNMYIARAINPNITYLTFATGLGVLPGNPIYNTLYIAHEGEYNVDRPYKNTLYTKVEGFSIIELETIINRMLVTTMRGLYK